MGALAQNSKKQKKNFYYVELIFIQVNWVSNDQSV